MFTGIIEKVGLIIGLQKNQNDLKIKVKSDFSPLTLGESITADPSEGVLWTNELVR